LARAQTAAARAVFYATLTNVVAFLPLLLVKGKTGDFIYSLPIVVSFSLLASMLVAWTFAPLLGFYAQGSEGLKPPTASLQAGFRVHTRHSSKVASPIASTRSRSP
jgi:multidrug efflux pump subunit AcrB